MSRQSPAPQAAFPIRVSWRCLSSEPSPSRASPSWYRPTSRSYIAAQSTGGSMYASGCDARPGFRAPFSKERSACSAAPMQETIDQPLTAPVATDSLLASAERASEWAGEPFLHREEDVA